MGESFSCELGVGGTQPALSSPQQKVQGRVIFRPSAVPFLSQVMVEAERGRSWAKMWLVSVRSCDR